MPLRLVGGCSPPLPPAPGSLRCPRRLPALLLAVLRLVSLVVWRRPLPPAPRAAPAPCPASWRALA
ncbi:hypothetical protein C3R44_24440, partial [Mycobacterium tuberculosis]